MGKRGPAKTPTSLALVRGQRADRINKNEPLPDGDAQPPEWLEPAALAAWKALAPSLIRQRVLTAWDAEAFAGFCTAVARRADAERHLQEEGAVVEAPVYNKNGDLVGHRDQRNQWLLVQKQAVDEIARIGGRFGLTPSDRAQLDLDPGKREAAGARRLLSS